MPSVPCRDRKAHQDAYWVVTMRRYNASAFNGYRPTRSMYSEVICPECPGRWRTKAGYVDTLPDAPGAVRPAYLFNL